MVTDALPTSSCELWLMVFRVRVLCVSLSRQNTWQKSLGEQRFTWGRSSRVHSTTWQGNYVDRSLDQMTEFHS